MKKDEERLMVKTAPTPLGILVGSDGGPGRFLKVFAPR